MTLRQQSTFCLIFLILKIKITTTSLIDTVDRRMRRNQRDEMLLTVSLPSLSPTHFHLLNTDAIIFFVVTHGEGNLINRKDGRTSRKAQEGTGRAWRKPAPVPAGRRGRAVSARRPAQPLPAGRRKGPGRPPALPGLPCKGRW